MNIYSIFTIIVGCHGQIIYDNMESLNGWNINYDDMVGITNYGDKCFEGGHCISIQPNNGNTVYMRKEYMVPNNERSNNYCLKAFVNTLDYEILSECEYYDNWCQITFSFSCNSDTYTSTGVTVVDPMRDFVDHIHIICDDTTDIIGIELGITTGTYNIMTIYIDELHIDSCKFIWDDKTWIILSFVIFGVISGIRLLCICRQCFSRPHYTNNTNASIDITKTDNDVDNNDNNNNTDKQANKKIEVKSVEYNVNSLPNDINTNKNDAISTKGNDLCDDPLPEYNELDANMDRYWTPSPQNEGK